MRIPLRLSRIFYAAAMIGLGVIGFVNGGLALVWQYIPAHPGPALQAIAYACATLELSCGLGLLFPRTVRFALRILFPYMLLWAVAVKLRVVFLLPKEIDSWGTFGEIAIMLVGAWCLFASHAGAWEQRRLGSLTGERGIRWARLLLIVCLPMEGLVHFMGIKDVADFVPAWLPFHVFWAYLTGAGFMAAAAGILFGVLPRLATNLLAFQLACITFLTWGAILDTGRTACTAFFISALITAGAWVVADTYRGVPWFASGRVARGVSLD
jgi:uncharacterized membrane protein